MYRHLECFIMSLTVVQNTFFYTSINFQKGSLFPEAGNRNGILLKIVSSSFSP